MSLTKLKPSAARILVGWLFISLATSKGVWMILHLRGRLAVVFLSLFISLFIFGPDSFADAATGCRLVIHVDKIRNQKGVLGATVFRSPDGWPEKNDKSFHHGPFPITGTTGTASFDNLPTGDYAVAVIHDENENRKVDRNFLGWPLEGFGFANNPKVLLEAPSFKQSLVHVSCPVTQISIHMIYK